MKSVTWVTDPYQGKEYYVKKLADVRNRLKLNKSPTLLDEKNHKEVEKELNLLINKPE